MNAIPSVPTYKKLKRIHLTLFILAILYECVAYYIVLFSKVFEGDTRGKDAVLTPITLIFYYVYLIGLLWSYKLEHFARWSFRRLLYVLAFLFSLVPCVIVTVYQLFAPLEGYFATVGFEVYILHRTLCPFGLGIFLILIYLVSKDIFSHILSARNEAPLSIRIAPALHFLFNVFFTLNLGVYLLSFILIPRDTEVPYQDETYLEFVARSKEVYIKRFNYFCPLLKGCFE